MPYAILFEASTKRELEAVWGVYGPKFQEEMTDWLSEIAQRAESRDYALSFDWLELATDIAQTASGNSWRHSLRRWLAAKNSHRFKAFLAFLKKRCPPWELRTVCKPFFVASSFSCSITAFLEIDHVQKRVVFRFFDGLPGAD